MTGLPWVRLDANIATHDKILELIARYGIRGKAAAAVYAFALGYSGGHGTEGLVTFAALPVIHCTKVEAAMLVDVGLWRPHPLGWCIGNWHTRQQSMARTAAIQSALSRAGVIGNCRRWHQHPTCEGDCGCACHEG